MRHFKFYLGVLAFLLLVPLTSAAGGGFASCTPGPRGGVGDQYCGSFNHVCTTQSSGEYGSYACNVDNPFQLCNTACSAGANNYGECVCVHNDDGSCVSPSQCISGSHQGVGGSCTVNGETGEIWTCKCSSCSNTLTYCKEVPEPTPTQEPEEEPEEDEEEGSNWYYNPYGPYCRLSAYPSYLYPGSSSEISVIYYNLFFPPWSVFVDCGNGHSTYAFGCYGTTGYCYAECSYPSAGTYYVNAYAAGTFCYPTVVNVVGEGGGEGEPEPTPTVYPSSCEVNTNPDVIEGSGESTITVEYSNMFEAPDDALVICGNGETVYADCEGSAVHGSCVGTCAYGAAGEYPAYYTVDSVVDGWRCSPDSVLLVEEDEPECEDPGDFIVRVTDRVNDDPIEDASVVFDNQEVFFTDENGEAFVYDVEDGTHSFIASRIGYESRTVQADAECGETTVVEIALNPYLDESCQTTVNPATVRGGGRSTVTVLFNGFAEEPSQALIDCGNGQIVSSGECAYSDGSGSCTAQCGYGFESDYPVYYVVNSNVDGLQCSSANVKVVAPIPETGNLLVKVTECATGKAIQSALLEVYPRLATQPIEPRYYTDQYGQATAVLGAGVYDVEASKTGYLAERASATVIAGRTTSLAICLDYGEEGCSYSVELLGGSAEDGYQLKVSSLVNQSQTIYVTYSNDYVSGPALVQLLAYQETVMDVEAIPQGGAGGVFAILTFRDEFGSCTKNVQLPFNLNEGLTIDAIETEKTAFGGQETCFALLVRNHGLDRGQVVLSATPFGSTQDYDWNFEPEAFMIASQETRYVEFCVDVPGGANEDASYFINASSPLGDDSTSVHLNVPGAAFSTSLEGGCKSVDSTTTVTLVELNVYNSAFSGDYKIELGENELGAVTQENLYAFGKGETRTIFMRLNAFGKEAGSYYVEFRLVHEGAVVYQDDLCFKVAGDNEVYAQLVPNVLSVPKGSGASTFLKLKNLGTVRSIYDVKTTGNLNVLVTPDTVALNPDEEASVEIHVSAGSTAKGSYTVPVQVWGCEGGATKHYYDDYLDVDFYCGDGESESKTCYGESGSCSAYCSYADSGYYYEPEAEADGTDCDDYAGYVRVFDEFDDDSCTVNVDGNALTEGESTQVKVSYFDLHSSSIISVEVNCGNGETHACTGDSGDDDCTVTCDYDDEGHYVVSAKAGGVTCYDARVSVWDEEDGECILGTNKQNALEDESVRLTARYYGFEDGGYYETVKGSELLETENLLVNIVSASGHGSFNVEESDSLQIVASNQIELPVSGATSYPVVLKNNNYYTLSSVLLSVEGLPIGVTATPISPLELEPGEERTVYLYLRSDEALEGTYQLTLQAHSAILSSRKKTVPLVVKSPTAEELNVAVQQGAVVSTTLDGLPALKTAFTVTNNEEVAVGITPSLALPEGWNYALSPNSLSLQPGETQQLQATLIPPQDGGEGEIELLLRANNKVKRVAVNVEPDQGLLSLGFFTAALGSNFALLVLVVLLLAGGYLLYSADRRMQEAEEPTEVSISESKKKKRGKGVSK
ncbi:hypothetical protein COT57_03455 [Candidatus Micrarchaeota archaeon CG09_land_8_20_14_0_10_55_25]|nr:MAG: hypothetical protein COT57_03455 [Candidatus Micrarchaeota archaeon CG09_land_8_20_14_0_10_55_25]